MIRRGVIINSDYRRYSLRTNVNAKLSDKLRGSLKVNFARRETNNVSGGFNTSGIVAEASAWAPTTPAYDANGRLTAADPISSIKTNPIEMATNDNINENSTFSTNGNFIYQIIEGLTFDLGFGVNYNNSQGKSFQQSLLTNNPSATRSSGENLFLQNTNNLTYTRTFNEIHNISITAVAEYQWQKYDYYSANATNLLFPFLKYNNITLAKTYALSNNWQKSTIGSYIGRASYLSEEQIPCHSFSTK